MKKGDILELNIQKYAFEGRGVAKINKDDMSNYVIFVDGSYPGDIVKAMLKKIKKNFAEASTVEILKPSEYRTTHQCRYFRQCGGCKQQDLSYTAQTMYKQKQVEEIFNKLGGFKDFIIEPVLPSDKIFYYRNKMEFSFDKRWLTDEEIKSGTVHNRDFAVGLHVPNVFDKVIDINECFLQSEISNKILNITRDFFKKRNSTIYSTKTHTGYLRNLVVKQAHKTKDLMVNIVTSSENDELMKQYSAELLETVPEITTIVNNISQKKAAIAAGDYEKIIYGSGYIYDYIGKYKFRISANSFFQTNTLQAEKLYDAVLRFAEIKNSDIVYDLYSGAGTIAIYMSEHADKIFAFESVESALKDAEVNTELNSVNNISFFNADLYKSFLPIVFSQNIPGPDIIVTDPPRGGMHENTIEDILNLSPSKIIYVSCNPTTQVRDIKLLTRQNYKLVKIQPVDMFPHTFHIENVALLQKI